MPIWRNMLERNFKELESNTIEEILAEIFCEAMEEEICKEHRCGAKPCIQDEPSFTHHKEFERYETVEIADVIFNDPATIVKWTDGTKTVVKCDGDKFDQEKGLAMAIIKKMLGNTGNYYELFREYCSPEYVREKHI